MKTIDYHKAKKQNSLTPLYILLNGIVIVSIALTYIFPSNTFMMYLMGVWFFSFGALKLIDLPSFVRSFALYDIIAQRWANYGYIYPFIEITLGLIYILNTQMQYMTEINIVALVIALFGIVSAYRVIASGQSITCACMGTYWQLPMTRVTIIENGAMFLMIAYMLLYPASMMNMSMSDTMMMDMGGSSDGHIMQVNESSINSSNMMKPVSTPADDAMRAHCLTMPAMVGCEKYR
ncbi:hypothetical protein H7169_01380 [Candidatus Gracilibacteria bacterium]|nr:hypothetical protein [Candidatus Gracilibacteria bacterium]